MSEILDLLSRKHTYHRQFQCRHSHFWQREVPYPQINYHLTQVLLDARNWCPHCLAIGQYSPPTWISCPFQVVNTPEPLP